MFAKILFVVIVVFLLNNTLSSMREMVGHKFLNVVLMSLAIVSVLAIVVGVFVDVEGMMVELFVDTMMPSSGSLQELLM